MNFKCLKIIKFNSNLIQLSVFSGKLLKSSVESPISRENASFICIMQRVSTGREFPSPRRT